MRVLMRRWVGKPFRARYGCAISVPHRSQPNGTGLGAGIPVPRLWQLLARLAPPSLPRRAEQTRADANSNQNPNPVRKPRLRRASAWPRGRK